MESHYDTSLFLITITISSPKLFVILIVNVSNNFFDKFSCHNCIYFKIIMWFHGY